MHTKWKITYIIENTKWHKPIKQISNPTCQHQKEKDNKATNVFAFAFVAEADPPCAQNIWPLCKMNSILSPMILYIPALNFLPRLLLLPHLLWINISKSNGDMSHSICLCSAHCIVVPSLLIFGVNESSWTFPF